MSDISSGRLKLPGIQRASVWKPTQVANLVESLYLGYPTGSLLLWETEDLPETRAPIRSVMADIGSGYFGWVGSSTAGRAALRLNDSRVLARAETDW